MQGLEWNEHAKPTGFFLLMGLGSSFGSYRAQVRA